MQQWSRRYLAGVQCRGPPRKRGPIHAYLRLGVDRFGLNRAVDVIINLLHIAVFLFIAGLLEFFFDLNSLVAYVLLGVTALALAVYMVLTILPVFYPECPYVTPLSSMVQLLAKTFIFGAAQLVSHTIILFYRRNYLWELPDPWNKVVEWCSYLTETFIMTRNAALAACGSKISYHRPMYVLQQMLSSLDEDDEMYELFVCLPAYFASLLARVAIQLI